MSAPKDTITLPPLPSTDLLAWVMSKPQDAAAYIRAIRSMSRLEVVVVQNGVTKRFPLVLSGENAMVELKL